MHWKETADVVARLANLQQQGHCAAVATVVRIEGSAYRRPGAKLLITADSGTLGSVSGGCLEADVRAVAQEVMLTGVPSLRRYDTRSHEELVFGLGLGCEGLVEVFVHSGTEGPLAGLAAHLCRQLQGDEPVTLATVIEGPRAGSLLVVDAGGAHGGLGDPELDREVERLARSAMTVSQLLRRGPHRVFIERLKPPQQLIICGAGDDALPLVAYAVDAGFRVTVVDHRPALLTTARFSQASRLLEARPGDEGIDLPVGHRTSAVVKMHSFAHDREWTRYLLRAGCAYVGLLGPRQRTATIVSDIGADHDERVFGPVGLDVAAEGPHQIAISILAEILAVIAHREPRHLSERKIPIHAS